MKQELDSTRFVYENKTYKVLDGNLYQVNDGLSYTDVVKGSELEKIALNHGFTGNIKDKIDGFHNHYYTKEQ